MAVKNRTDLKLYFNTGDIPTEENYSDLIDSFVVLGETDLQILDGDVSASSFIAENHITCSGNISGSGTTNLTIGGTVSAGNATFNDGNISNVGIIEADILQADGTQIQVGSNSVATDNIFLNGPVTASGNISASGNITAANIDISSITNVNTTHITASGDISASGDLTIGGKSHFIGHITASGNISSSGTILADTYKVDGYAVLGNSGTDIELGNETYWDRILYGRQSSDQHNFTGNITASGNISSSGIIFTDNLRSGDATKTLILDTDDLYHKGTSFRTDGHITASGNISSSGNFSTTGTGHFGSHITASGGISSSGTITAATMSSAQWFSHAGDPNTGISLSDDSIFIKGNDAAIARFTTRKITLEQNVTASGAISASGKLTATSLNTGQGDNELYDMNQNVTTTSTVNFNSLHLTIPSDTVDQLVTNQTSTLPDGSRGAQLNVGTIESLGPLRVSNRSVVEWTDVQAGSVVVGSHNAAWYQLVIFGVDDGTFQWYMFNPTGNTLGATSVTINFQVF
jgi:hypothetical protein